MLKQVEREDGVKEYFISETFIQSEEWNTILSDPSFPTMLLAYEYIKDYVKCNGEEYGHELTSRLKFSEIIHATNQSELLSIISDGGFKPGRKSIPDCDLDTFVWFGVKIGQPEVDALKDDYTMQCKMEKQDLFVDLGITPVDCSSIVNSPCFEPMSRYGEFKLAFEIQNVINAYSQQFCREKQETGDCPKPDFRILGTFIYKMETMHTVLVCPPGNEDAEKYPLLDQSKQHVIWEDPDKKGTFIWCPDSTGDKDKASEIRDERRPFRRWEHVTFAFYVPDDKILKLDNVSSHISVCIYEIPSERFRKVFIKYTIQTFLDKVSEESSIETKRWMVNLLIRSVRGYLDEEKVFEKMNILYMYKPVDLDTVVDRVEKLLGGKEFDWSPLIEWMKDVQQTNNQAVLCSILKYLNKQRELCTTKLQSRTCTNDYTAGPHQIPQL